MGRVDFLYDHFIAHLGYEPTPGQNSLLKDIAAFVSDDEGDILVVNGYAGTGKTTAVAAVVEALKEFEVPTVLLAPTGRSAKTLSLYAHAPAYTIHKYIYRQKSVNEEGFGLFNLGPSKDKYSLFIVDEVSLIGIDASGSSTAQFGTGNLLEDLIRFVRNGTECKLILIGDGAQLPPVGLDCSPALSKEYMSFAGGVRYATLTDVVRQKKESGILKNATCLRQIIAQDDFYGMERSDLQLDVEGFDDIERIGGGELIEALSDACGRYGEDETVVLCRSNKRANKYNAGIRAMVQYREEKLVRGDKLMVVKNCYQFLEDVKEMDYIANGDMAKLVKIHHFTERYGLHFADATLSFPDYDDLEIDAKVCLDTLESESPSLTYEQQNLLYQGVNADYAHITSKKKRYEAVREDPFYNALQLKYANAITCHKSQGGQWSCVFIDNALWQEEVTLDDLKWLYTAVTRGVEKVYLVNFNDDMFR